MVTAASRKSDAARLPDRLVRDDKTLPPDILLPGARQSQEVICFALGHERREQSRQAGPAQTMPSGTTSGTPQLLLAHHLKQLKLPTILREYDKVAREAARDGIDHAAYLLRLVELELIDRERRVVERRIRQARFPAVKSLDTFDFAVYAARRTMPNGSFSPDFSLTGV